MRANMKKLLAVLMALTVVLSFAACGKTEKPETKESTTISEDADATNDNGEEVNAEADDEETEDVEDNKTDSAKKTTKKSTGKTTKSSAKTTTKKSGSKTTKKDGKKTTKSGSKKTTKSGSKKTTKSDGKKTTKANKMSQAEILKLYATATEKAQMAKSFNKKRSTTSNSEIGGAAAIYKSKIYQFLGIGEKNVYENKSEDGEIYTWKDKDDQIRFCVTKSALTEKDIKSATIKEDGGNYIVTIKVKDGSSSSGKNGEGAKNNSPVDRCGICTGERDIDIYDHKTAEICCKAGGSLISSAEEKTSNVVVTATINKSSGKLTNLKIKFDIDAELKAFGSQQINATGTTTVTVKNFKY